MFNIGPETHNPSENVAKKHRHATFLNYVKPMYVASYYGKSTVLRLEENFLSLSFDAGIT